MDYKNHKTIWRMSKCYLTEKKKRKRRKRKRSGIYTFPKEKEKKSEVRK